MSFSRLQQSIIGRAFITLIAAAILATFAHARQEESRAASTSTVLGTVRDSGGHPVVDALVLLQDTIHEETVISKTLADSNGRFYFHGLSPGTYTVRAEKNGREFVKTGEFSLTSNQTKTMELTLSDVSPPVETNANSKPASVLQSKAPEWFDEPQFTVAGVTAATNSGGHGSDTVLRSSDALVKATVSLGKDKEADANALLSKSTTADAPPKAPRELARLRQRREKLESEVDQEPGRASMHAGRADVNNDSVFDQQARLKQSGLHHELARIAEELGDPLQAVREYQRACELSPTETNLFDWASELLSHRALEPATEVFTRGNQLYPKSARMLIGLGVSVYARGSYDRAAQYLAAASDLAPADLAPYLFMGKMQSVEVQASKDTSDRLARFARQEPGNALANYYYAVSLWKLRSQSGAAAAGIDTQVEALLNKTVQLDPKLGVAYLQLGILYVSREDYAHAIPAYQKAIEATPELEEAHYRLAQAYRRTGEGAKAKQELELHEQLSKHAKDEAERERGEIQQFVISLRDKKPNSHEP